MQARPSVADCAKSAREDMIVSRLHFTSIVKTLEGQHEDFRYLITGVNGGRYIPLLWRKRNIQANMTVRDGQNNHLPYLPSRVSDSFCEEYLLQLWKDFDLSIAGPQIPPWIADARERSLRLTRFEYDPEDAKAAQEEWAKHAGDFPSNQAFVKLKVFIDHIGENYIPVVSIPESSEEFLFLHHGVDVSTLTRRGFRRQANPKETVYSTWDKVNLALTGGIRLDVPILIDAFIGPPWKQTESLHVRVVLPEGMVLDGPVELVPKTFFADTNILNLTEITEEYVYSYVSKNDASRFITHLTDEQERADVLHAEIASMSKAIREKTDPASLRRLRKDADSATAEKPPDYTFRDVFNLYAALFGVIKRTRQLRRQRRLIDAGENPTLRVQLRLNWTMKILLFLLWVVIGCTVGVEVLGLLGADAYIALLGSLLLVVLTLAIFSLDKPFLRIPFAGHTVLTTGLFLVVPVAVPLLVRILS